MTTIADKRAQLYREWFLATLSNDENYYFSTLALGVPDGDTEQDLLWDLEGGWYDKDIDDTIKSGMDDYLIKPITMHSLYEKINKYKK